MRFFRIFALVAAIFCFPQFAHAQAVQNHGLVFEKWIRDTFFEAYTPPSTTQKWDIPAEVNTRFGRIPVNPKAIKYGASVDLGDALRQIQIEEPFWLVVGFWQQEGSKKRFVNAVTARIEPPRWKALWGDVTLADVQKLDKIIKETPDYREARRLAAQMKKTAPFPSSIISLNPKIDSKTQRRLQCSISWGNVWKYLAPEADKKPQDKPEIWGQPLEIEIESPPRELRKTETDATEKTP